MNTIMRLSRAILQLIRIFNFTIGLIVKYLTQFDHCIKVEILLKSTRKESLFGHAIEQETLLHAGNNGNVALAILTAQLLACLNFPVVNPS